MSFFSKLFSRKKEKVKTNVQSNYAIARPQYVILRDRDEDDEFASKSKEFSSYKILDTKENMKLGLHINHYDYNASGMTPSDYYNENKKGSYVEIELVIGDFYHSIDDKDSINYRISAKALDKDIGRIASKDDADFAFYTKLQEELKSKNNAQAILMHTLLKVVKSNILTSPSRVTEEYREQQTQKNEAEKIAKERALKTQREIYRQEQLKIAEEQKQVTLQKQEKISTYMQKIKADILVK